MTSIFEEQQIIVEPEWIKRCKTRASNLVDHHRRVGFKDKYSKGGQNVTQQKKTTLTGAIGEVAICKYLGLDPETFLNWQTETPVGGVDLKVNGKTIDVKASDNPFASRLMWPVTKLADMERMADVLIFVRVIGAKVQLVGWVLGREFIAWHSVAKNMRGIVDGTPYLDEKRLYSIDQLGQYLGDIKTTN